MARQLDRGKERFWRGMMQHWRRSGLSVRDFCAEHGLAEPSFYAWRRTLARRDQQAATTSAAHTQHASVSQPLFVPLHVVPTPANAALELVLGRGRGRPRAAGLRCRHAASSPRRPGGGAVMLSLPLPVRIFLCTEHADLRKSFDGLAQLVREFLGPIRSRATSSSSATNAATASSCSTGTATAWPSGTSGWSRAAFASRPPAATATASRSARPTWP